MWIPSQDAAMTYIVNLLYTTDTWQKAAQRRLKRPVLGIQENTPCEC